MDSNLFRDWDHIQLADIEGVAAFNLVKLLLRNRRNNVFQCPASLLDWLNERKRILFSLPNGKVVDIDSIRLRYSLELLIA